MLITGVPTSLAVPVLPARRPDQRPAVVASVALLAVGLLGLLLARDVMPLVWVAAAGAAQGSLLGPTFLFFSVRTPDAVAPGRLAAMAQKFGFFIAALVFLVLMLAPMLAFGCGRRARQI